MLLSSEFFEFSFQELLIIILYEASGDRWIFWCANGIIITVSAILFFLLIQRIRLRKFAKIALISVYSILLIFFVININQQTDSLDDYNSSYEYMIAKNKIAFLAQSTFNSYTNKRELVNQDTNVVLNKINSFRQKYEEKGFISVEYPLIRKKIDANVLGEQFVKKEIKPNIVFVVCESLSSGFCGKNALFHMTPFLDSLIDHSLYWENCFSSSSRTYGVLPSLLGSIPSGDVDRGFINMNIEGKARYPSHISIFRNLEENAYSSNYFYGGWGEFDHVQSFMNYNGLDHFYDKSTFDTSMYSLNREREDDKIWGYNDKDLFRHSFEKLGTHHDSSYLTVYQTLSVHSPYNMVESQYCDTEYIKRRYKQVGVDVQLAQKYMSPGFIRSVIFADDALKEFFNQYKMRADFENTIFIITGDHTLGLSFGHDYLKRYRVPLIIYSPLLKTSKHYKGVVSHFDVLPSLLSLLDENFDVNINLWQHYLGIGLDTSSTFKANRMIPMNIFRENAPKFIYKDYVVIGQDVYKFGDNFTFTKLDVGALKDEVIEVFQDYLVVNNYVCTKNKLWDDRFWR
ncbi:MAG: LTA synthase family protein [Bacteroidales bacterium]|nr:LTA synthase family protein [Bacteroidales bacterium]